MIEVRPCPFCGSNDLDVPREGDVDPRRPTYFLRVRCKSCQGEGPAVHVEQRREDGAAYAYYTRMPRSPLGEMRWRETHAAAARDAVRKWNVRIHRLRCDCGELLTQPMPVCDVCDHDERSVTQRCSRCGAGRNE